MKKVKFKQIILTALMLTTLAVNNIATQAVQAVTSTQSQTVASQTSSQGQAIDANWGLGTTQTEYVSNNKSYNWYIDQANTGTYSNNNCGPSSVTMALKWIDEKFNKTGEDARNSNKKNGEWWSTDDITHYLDTYGGKYVTKALSENSLKTDLKQGNIAILCIDTSYLPYNNKATQRVGKFYDFSGGHFIVVKGYRVVDGKTYFESYDPNSWGQQYKDGQEKGKDRYYLSQDLMEAARNHWNYSITIKPNSTKSSNSINSNNPTKSSNSTTSTDSTNSTKSTKSNDSAKSTKTTDSSNLTDAANSSFWYWFNWFY